MIRLISFHPNPRIPISARTDPSRNCTIRPSHRVPITLRPQIRRIAVRAEKEDLNGVEDGKDDEVKKKASFDLKWGELLLNPEPDNVLAVGLAGLLTLASAQVVWQVLVVSVAILVAALKYSFIAALLLFILITLL